MLVYEQIQGESRTFRAKQTQPDKSLCDLCNDLYSLMWCVLNISFASKCEDLIERLNQKAQYAWITFEEHIKDLKRLFAVGDQTTFCKDAASLYHVTQVDLEKTQTSNFCAFNK